MSDSVGWFLVSRPLLLMRFLGAVPEYLQQQQRPLRFDSQASTRIAKALCVLLRASVHPVSGMLVLTAYEVNPEHGVQDWTGSTVGGDLFCNAVESAADQRTSALLSCNAGETDPAISDILHDFHAGADEESHRDTSFAEAIEFDLPSKV